MRILVVNDDGADAPNLRPFAAALTKDGHDVTVVVPERPQSAMSHAITLHKPLRVTMIDGVHAVSGTPVDSTYMGLFAVMKESPHLIISGINKGYNLGRDVYYSGTVAAAMEGALRGIRSIALSADRRCDPTGLAVPAMHAVRFALSKDNWRMLNFNIPSVDASEIRVCGLGRRDYQDRVVECRDPRGGKYYWLGGDLPEVVAGDDTDVSVVAENKISVTPLSMSWEDQDVTRGLQ